MDAYGIRLTQKGYKAIGVDISIKQCEFVKKRTEIEKINFPIINSDLNNLPFKECVFDSIFCGAVLHHFPNINSVIGNLYKILKRGGHIIIVEPNGSNLLIRFYFTINYVLTKLFRKSCLTVNERAHRLNTYYKVLRKRGFNSIKIHLLKRNESKNIFKRCLINIWMKIMPPFLGATEVVITAKK